MSTGRQMNPDLIFASKKALVGLMSLIEIQDSNLSLESFPELFIPCNDGKLHCSSDVVIVDKSWLERLPNFGQPIFDDLVEYSRERAIDIFRKLPEQLQPKLLSSIIVEKLDHTCEVTTSIAAVDMLERLQSPVFQRGLEKILRFSETTAKDASKHSTNVSREDIVEIISNIKIVAVD